MDHWPTLTLGEICTIRSGKSAVYAKTLEHPYKVYGANGVIGSHTESNFDDGFLVGRVGACGFVHRIDEPVWASDNTLTLRVQNPAVCDKSFLGHLLAWLNLARYATKTAQPLLTQAVLRSIPVRLPPLSEQRQIAAILTCLDEVAAVTERVIGQMERVKRGLMQRFLTRGVRHTDFKRTPIGELPSGWDVAPIGCLCRTTSGGTPKRDVAEYYENGSIPWVKTGELGVKYLYGSEERITEEALQHSSAKRLPPNTVLVAMYGATIGKSSILKVEAATNQACCAILCDERRVHHEFLYYVMTWRQADLVRRGMGGAQPNISQQLIREFLIPVPPVEEQRQIAAVLASVDEKLDHERKTLRGYRRLKASLAGSLLTGRMRVREVLESRVPCEHGHLQTGISP
ncbi:MAG: restriction endonuclease subunit S [Alicyclobacillaceae bacterium]|nr:restriction endonuclease subunit S [Alicyclobacillaceae bacterium]